MEKKLPSVYPVPIDKKLNNNREIFKSSEEGLRMSPLTVKEINDLFNAKDHVYKTKVKLTTKKETKVVEVVGLSHNNLLTLEGEKIPLDIILDIKKV